MHASQLACSALTEINGLVKPGIDLADRPDTAFAERLGACFAWDGHGLLHRERLLDP